MKDKLQEAKDILGCWPDTLIGMTDYTREEMLNGYVAGLLEAQDIVSRHEQRLLERKRINKLLTKLHRDNCTLGCDDFKHCFVDFEGLYKKINS